MIAQDTAIYDLQGVDIFISKIHQTILFMSSNDTIYQGPLESFFVDSGFVISTDVHQNIININWYFDACRANFSYRRNIFDQWPEFESQRSILEKKSHIVFFFDETLIYEDIASVGITGNYSSYRPGKSHVIKFSKDSPFVYDIFDDGHTKYRKLWLRKFGTNPNRPSVDLLANDVLQAVDVGAQAGRPAVVYLNGEYWGVYNLRERIDKFFC
ncbi:MAG: CotH kinase family protein [Candidatus Pacebacteria bacterium]|nr:CotH kinase family protein [Candidatus Paceibacterota bacterium]